jgi:hypothetical protein
MNFDPANFDLYFSINSFRRQTNVVAHELSRVATSSLALVLVFFIGYLIVLLKHFFNMI